MLDAIKHITDDNYFFHEDSAQAYYACNTVQLSKKNVIFVFSCFARLCRSTSYLRWHSKASFDRLLISKLATFLPKNVKIKMHSCMSKL